MLAEKNRLAEEEAMLLNHKACEVEQEISRMRLSALKTEEEKLHLERKTREAEIITARLVEDSKKRQVESEKLKNDLIYARVAEKEAKEKLLNFLSRSTTISPPSPPPIVLPIMQHTPSYLGNDFLSSSLSLQSASDSTQTALTDNQIMMMDDYSGKRLISL